ncbi:MAG: hypothetical protein H0U10_06055 [Chloroflexia bacterium]|jgi:hypothetical protein|nr:hypothetical protein [Chloroflexia bacterium]
MGALGLALASRRFDAFAQDATPAPAAAVGVSAQLLGIGQPAAAPGLELTLRRITIAVGGSIPPHSHPGALVIFVESGAFGYTALGGTIELTRAAVDGTPAPAEEMPTGTEVILNPGDRLFVEDPMDDVRNAGEDELVLLVSGLTRVGEPFTTLMGDMDMGTPTT